MKPAKKKIYLSDVEAAKEVNGPTDQEMTGDEYKIGGKAVDSSEDGETYQAPSPDELKMSQEEKDNEAYDKQVAEINKEKQKVQYAPGAPQKDLVESAQGSMSLSTKSPLPPKNKIELMDTSKIQPWQDVVRKLKNIRSSTDQLMEMNKYKAHPEAKRIKKMVLGY